MFVCIQIFFIYSVAVFCVELQQRFVEGDDSLNFIPFVSGLLPFEKILVILNSLATAAFLSIGLCLSVPS